MDISISVLNAQNKVSESKRNSKHYELYTIQFGTKERQRHFQSHEPSLHFFGILRENLKWIAHIKIAHT
jgi:hypothetical protein